MNGRNGPAVRSLIFTTRIKAKSRIITRKRSKGRFNGIRMEGIWGEVVGLRGHGDSDVICGVRRRSINVVLRMVIGDFIWIGRLGHRAMKYENITSKPPM